MDNRVFNINGEGLPFLVATLKLAFMQETQHGAIGWDVLPGKGFVLLAYGDAPNKFPGELSAEECAPMVYRWLNSPIAKAMDCTGWDADSDHDGSNEYGWRVYVEDWGHVGKHTGGTICAIRPAYMWYGK